MHPALGARGSARGMEHPSPPWLRRFDRPSRLLLHTLTSGPSGALAAFRALPRVQSRSQPGEAFHWKSFIATLCTEEPVLEGPAEALTLKPLLLLLPVLCQRNLFSLLHTVQSTVPKDCLSQLLQAVRQDPSPDLWVRALADLLEQGLMEERRCSTLVPLTTTCQQQLKHFCQKITGTAQQKPELERKLNWCIRKPPGSEAGPAGDPDLTSQVKKRKKGAEESLEPEWERQKKKTRLDEVGFELGQSTFQRGADAASVGDEIVREASWHEPAQSQRSQQDAGTETRDASQSLQQDAAGEVGDASLDSQKDSAAKVPDSLQMHVPRLKMLLEKESNQSERAALPALQILNECSPLQLEGLCSLLQLSQCPEPVLVRFCTWLLALTPVLSYTNAAVLTRQLFLQRVLSLTQPASRHLMAALTSFCSKYPRPFCCALIAPVLQAPGEGSERMKLVCEVIEDCLEPEYLRLVLSQLLEVSWSEELITVVLGVLGRQVELPTELFNRLVLNLRRMAQEFATSMNYAKLLMTVLTVYASNVTSTHRSHMASVLGHNRTALKKSLQVALEQVAPR
ncbi:Fanconi anemia group E protein isoform X2 [Alligator mississippiensis]|uniref:Fanconi anemia group E protein isoform X2 n=1 Tax=Alligator mississippiensis TaxID=8496 RepID=UPI002877C5AF|nr:Fanconi anemia group E protein isoform X2 [Alligator mississippiensis]